MVRRCHAGALTIRLRCHRDRARAVEEDREQQHQAGGELDPEVGDVQQVQAVLDGADEQTAEERAEDVDDAAGEQRAADGRRREGGQQELLADGRDGGPEAQHEHDAGDAGQGSRERVGHHDDAVGGHAGHPGRALVGAGREHLAAQGGADGRAATAASTTTSITMHQPGDRQAEQRTRPAQVDEVRGQRPEGVGLGGDVHEAGEDARRAQRDDEGVDAGRDDDARR